MWWGCTRLWAFLSFFCLGFLSNHIPCGTNKTMQYTIIKYMKYSSTSNFYNFKCPNLPKPLKKWGGGGGGGRTRSSNAICKCFCYFLNLHLSVWDGCVVQCGSENKHCKDTCLEKIGLSLQTTLTTPHSTVNMIRIAFNEDINKLVLSITKSKAKKVWFFFTDASLHIC